MATESPGAPLILIVEDDNLHVSAIQRSFKNAVIEYRLVIVGSLSEAWVVMAKQLPDLVISDYKLPDGDGIDLLHALKGNCPLILMTSQGSEQIAVDAIKSGAQDYIVKSASTFQTLPLTAKHALETWSLVVARRKADEAVSRGKRDWERTFDAVPDLISIIDRNHIITRVNRAMAERFGLTPAELVGKKCCELVHGLDDSPAGCPVAGMMRNNLVHNTELYEKKLNGFFDVTVSPLFDEEGHISTYVHVMRDITVHKQAEQALLDSREKHKKLANEQRIILNATSVGICFLKDRKVLWTNPAFDLIFGYEPGTTCNLETAELYSDKETYEFVGKNGYSAIESGTIYSQDVMMKKKDGSPIWCNIVGQAVSPENAADGSIWIMLDITERIKAEQERIILEQQFQQSQKLESLGVLAGGIAHDFNNILTIILGHCYIVKENFDSGTSDKEHVLQIEAAGNRAAELCRQMLAYSGQSPQVQTSINLWMLVEDVVKMLSSAIKKNISIELLKHDVLQLTGDSAQIQQIVMNLIINAAEAIGDKNGTIQVVLEKIIIQPGQSDTDFMGAIIPARAYACLEVSDNGCGIDEETKKRIFEPFFTTKFTGRGLGMSAVLGIVKSHGGALQLSSTLGVGSIFKVLFPLPAVPDVGGTPTEDLVPVLKGSGTILLVDDEESLRIIGSALLNAMGFSTIIASDGSEALDIYRERGSEIDVILLDLIMPVMGGIEAYHELRKMAATVPIIICSGYGNESIQEVLDNDNYVDFVNKPYKPGELRDILMKR